MSAFGSFRSTHFAFLALAASTACGSGEANNGQAAPSDEHATQSFCDPTAPSECLEPAPHFADVAPIFGQRCASCHTGVKDAPWPLDSYEHVVDWAPVIRDELLHCLMPPANSGVEMTADERQAILVWVRCGALE